MNLRDPLNSLTFSLLHAIELGLDGVPSPEATELLGPGPDGERRRRPTKQECEVTLFTQSWRGADVGLGGPRHDRGVDLETVIVTGPQADVCVYAGPRLAYHIRHPNRRFFLDVAAQSMVAPRASGDYEGRDDAVIESVDYATEAQICRLHAALRHDAPSASKVSRLLQDYAQRFSALAHEGDDDIAGDAPLPQSRPGAQASTGWPFLGRLNGLTGG